MTKEQEEAIEILKEFKDKGYANLYIKYNGNRPKINLKIKNSIETILSMLEEKDEQIAEEQKAVEQIYADYQDIGKIAFDYQDKIELLEKQIDLIAERLRYESSMQQEFCMDICDKKKCNIDKCKERIKQYFENKAKEVE